MPWIIFGIHLWQYAIIGAAGFLVGLLAGTWWGQRRWRL